MTDFVSATRSTFSLFQPPLVLVSPRLPTSVTVSISVLARLRMGPPSPRISLVAYASLHINLYRNMYVHVYVYVYVYMYMCMYMHVYACVYVCICTCIYICVCICACTCICIYTYRYTTTRIVAVYVCLLSPLDLHAET